MTTLINPRRPSPQDDVDFLSEPVYLRNPNTGMIVKLFHKDTIARCLREFYMPSSEAELKAQAVELAELQNRPLPSTAPASAPAVVDDVANDPPVPSGRRPR